MSCEPIALIATLLVSAGDGDNLVAHIDGQRENMRVCGIDAPEVHGTVEPGGPESAAFLAQMVEGKRVDLYATTQGRDRYGRLVVVPMLDGSEMACLLIAAGHAEEVTRYSRGRYGDCGD